jgi:hypothetical protein
MLRSFAAPLALLGLVGGIALPACPNVGAECLCIACGTAINLNVVDADGNAIADWDVEATVDGQSVDTSSCTPGARAGANSCTFGFETGVYVIVIRSPFEEQEIAARFASTAADDCCNFGCIGRSTNVVATLTESE